MIVILAAIFATYRLACDFATERGPFDLYADLRGSVIAKYGKDDWRSEGITCPVCWSFWIAAPLALIVVLFASFDPWLIVLWWFGIAGAAAFLVRVTE